MRLSSIFTGYFLSYEVYIRYPSKVHHELGSRGVVLAERPSVTRIYEPGLEKYILEIDGVTYLSVLDSRDLALVEPLIHPFVAQNVDRLVVLCYLLP